MFHSGSTGLSEGSTYDKLTEKTMLPSMRHWYMIFLVILTHPPNSLSALGFMQQQVMV
jgi:hypothetical protein